MSAHYTGSSARSTFAPYVLTLPVRDSCTRVMSSPASPAALRLSTWLRDAWHAIGGLDVGRMHAFKLCALVLYAGCMLMMRKGLSTCVT